MGALAATYDKTKTWLTDYLANDDPYAAIANTGAFIVWSNQPFYPLYVAWCTSMLDAWPSLLTWLSTPFFFAVPLLNRRDNVAGRALFVGAGLANSLLALKAFGPGSGIGWFFLPCLVIALLFFRRREWRVALGLAIVTGLCSLCVGRFGAPFHLYTAAETAALATLNIVSVVGLTLYLLVAALRVRLSGADVQSA